LPPSSNLNPSFLTSAYCAHSVSSASGQSISSYNICLTIQATFTVKNSVGQITFLDYGTQAESRDLLAGTSQSKYSFINHVSSLSHCPEDSAVHLFVGHPK